jgi:hypothetical protein
MEESKNPLIQMVKIGTLNMTTDALFVVIFGILFFIILSFKYGFKRIHLLILLSYMISAYQINCMIIGECYFLSKYLSISLTINGILLLLNYNIK